MRVLVDARPVMHYPTLRGVGQTLLSLYNSVAACSPDWSFDLVYQLEKGSTRFDSRPNVNVHVIDGKGDRFKAWQHLWLPVHAVRSRADVLHCHGGIGPRMPLVPMLVTIHDLTPLEFRKDDADVQEWGRDVARTARKAHRVLTPSEYVRREVHRALQIPLNKIRAVHWGPNERCRPPDPVRAAEIRRQYGLLPDRQYVVHFGMTMARKNTGRLMTAWSGLSPDDRARFSLEIVGLEGLGLQHFEELAARLGIVSSCHCHGYLPEDHVAALLAGASGMAYVSLSEGFGLPILDAFACGAPVIASSNTCMPEIAGDAALLVDPYDETALRDSLKQLLSSTALRGELAERGRARLRAFSWAACADEVKVLLAECAR